MLRLWISNSFQLFPPPLFSNLFLLPPVFPLSTAPLTSLSHFYGNGQSMKKAFSNHENSTQWVCVCVFAVGNVNGWQQTEELMDTMKERKVGRGGGFFRLRNWTYSVANKDQSRKYSG